MSLPEKKEVLITRWSVVRDPRERFSKLVETARAIPNLPPEFRVETYKIPGCLSNLWFVARFSPPNCEFRADSDSAIVKAIACLLCDFYSGASPAEILAQEPDFLKTLGIHQHLSSNRRNGLGRIWEKIRTFALEHQPTGVRAEIEGAP
jgi:cysteine desulfuration protein SufE